MIQLQKHLYIAVIFSVASSSVLWADARVLHLSPDTPPVDVYVGTSNNPSATETPLLEDFPYLDASPYVPLPTNTYFIDVTPAGTSDVAIDVNDLAVDGATDYSIAAIGTFTVETPDDIPLEALVLVDDRTVDPANGKVRIAHTSPNAPAVDIVVSQLGAEPVVTGLAYKSDTGYLTLPPDIYDVTILEAGTNNEVLTAQLPVAASTNYSVFAVGLVGGTGDQAFGVLPLVDAVPEPGSFLLGLAGLASFGCIRRRDWA